MQGPSSPSEFVLGSAAAWGHVELTPRWSCPHSAQLLGSTLASAQMSLSVQQKVPELTLQHGWNVFPVAWRLEQLGQTEAERGGQVGQVWSCYWRQQLRWTRPLFLPLSPIHSDPGHSSTCLCSHLRWPRSPFPCLCLLSTNSRPGYLLPSPKEESPLTRVILIVLSVYLRIHSDWENLQGWALRPQGADEVWGS